MKSGQEKSNSMIEHISKPIDVNKLKRTISAVLENKGEKRFFCQDN